MLSRRRFLSTTVLAGAGATAAASQGHGFSVEPASEDLQAQYRAGAACHAASFHDRLVAEVEATLGGGTLTEEDKAELLRALTCPLCGCAIAGPR